MVWPVTNVASIAALQSGTDAERRAALATFTENYGRALYAFARREWWNTLSPEDCQDLVGDFLLECVSRSQTPQGLFDKYDPEYTREGRRTRFRNYLGSAFKRFGLNWLRDRAALLRRPRAGIESLNALLDDHRADAEPRADESAEDALDRVCRKDLFLRVLKEFKGACIRAGQEKKFQVFIKREWSPRKNGTPPPEYRDLRKELGLSSDDAVGRLVRAGAKEFDQRLAAAVAQDAWLDEAEVEQECRLTWVAAVQ